MNISEKSNASSHQDASVVRGASLEDVLKAVGFYTVECRDKNGVLKWRDTITNAVMTEGRNAMLTHAFKGSTYTAAVRMGLISSSGYGGAPDAADVASAINTTGSANGWNEAVAGTCASRGTPSFGSASGGSLALSANQAFSIVGTDTIKGVFILIKSAAGVDPTSTVANTAGALWSAGVFSGGDKAVGSGDTLNVSYSTTLS